MDALQLAALLDDAAGEFELGTLDLARQLHRTLDPNAPVLPRERDRRTLGRYSNEKAVELARAIRGSLGYEARDVADDLLPRLYTTFRIQAAPVACRSILGGTLVTRRHRLVFCSDGADDPAFQFAVECGRLLLSMASGAQQEVATLTIPVSGSRMPQKHYFARRFAAELLVSDEVLGAALRQARRELGVRSNTIGDLEILYVSRLLRLGFLNTAKRLELSHYLPRGGGESLAHHLDVRHGGAEQRALSVGFPPRPPHPLFSV